MLIMIIYAIAALVGGVSAWQDAGWLTGVSGLVAPLIACTAASGVKEAFALKNLRVVGPALAAGVCLFGLAYWMVRYTGFFVRIYGAEVSGPLWLLIGFVLAFFATTPKGTTAVSAG